jgi:hypothetical protein
MFMVYGSSVLQISVKSFLNKSYLHYTMRNTIIVLVFNCYYPMRQSTTSDFLFNIPMAHYFIYQVSANTIEMREQKKIVYHKCSSYGRGVSFSTFHLLIRSINCYHM